MHNANTLREYTSTPVAVIVFVSTYIKERGRPKIPQINETKKQNVHVLTLQVQADMFVLGSLCLLVQL